LVADQDGSEAYKNVKINLEVRSLDLMDIKDPSNIPQKLNVSEFRYRIYSLEFGTRIDYKYLYCALAW
jgi:hypothetical protein